MLRPFLSRFLIKKSSVQDDTAKVQEKIKLPLHTNPFETLQAYPDVVLFQEFILYHYTEPITIDLLIFLPDYGLYFGETLLWKVDELKNAKLERSDIQSKKSPTTRLGRMEKILHQKLQDVLSFDSTHIERIIWMKNITAEEFESLDTSFHDLLPKSRLIFSDDTPEKVLEKLYALSERQDIPYSRLKVIGSLQAHTLVLPNRTNPFGNYLSEAQHYHFAFPLQNLPHIINGNYGTGKSTILLRKVLQYLLENPKNKIGILTPSLLHGELLLKELISLVDFAAVKCDLNAILFYSPPIKGDVHELPNVFKEVSALFCDDVHLLRENYLHKVLRENQDKPVVMTTTFSDNARPEYALFHSYRTPSVTRLSCTSDDDTLNTLLNALKHYHTNRSEFSALLILPNDEMIQQYKHAIEERYPFRCETLNEEFSLQYKSFGDITLSTPEFINGLSEPHTYIINLNPSHPLYSLALSRASETVTIITQSE